MPKQSIAEWLKSIPIVWAFSNTNGQAAATAEGGLYDDQLDRLDQAVKQRMPDDCAADALPYVGDNSGLIQGHFESDDTFRARCKAKNDQWALAGTWAELLYQLYFTCGLQAGSTFVVQQNGQAYSLTANPSVDTDPTSIMQIEDLDLSYNVGDHSGTPWWLFDERSDLCSRFALIIDSPIPTSICPSITLDFDNQDSSTGQWDYPFDGPDYETMFSVVSEDGTTPLVSVTAQDATTITLTASAPFTGSVYVLGWPTGGNPFAGASQSMQNLIALICNRWKPAKAKFMGTWILVSGWMLGWPPGISLGDAGLIIGDSLVEQLEP